jgi:hypothetical protein
MPTDTDFDRVPVNSFTDNNCSPDVLSDFTFKGIKIAAPQKVALEGKPDKFGSFARVVVCGAYRMEANYLGLRERFLPRVIVVAIDQRSHIPYAGHVTGLFNAEPGESPFDKMPRLPDTAFNGRFVSQYFNTNLVQIMELPQVETDYVVYAVLGKYVSNVVRIALRR